jgi:hypothetical protein
VKAGDVIASAGTKKRLGPALGEVCGWLWPQDCQTCGRALAGQRPALCVDDHMAFAVATLHHQRCRKPVWNDSGQMTASPAAYVSWTSRAWAGLPLIHGGEKDPRPFVLVNPGLEMVFLGRPADGWQPQLPDSFAAAGLQKVGEVAVDRPVSGLAAQLSPGAVTVRFLVPPFEAYATEVDGSFARRARELRGLLFGVSHLVNPAELLTGQHVDTLMLTGTILIGWVGLRP